jgi:uncharacterized protein (TIGR02757 family)
MLEKELETRERVDELISTRPDPLMVAKRYNDEYISLVCALFAYGNAHQIVKFLSSLDFSLLDRDEDIIREGFKDHYYRFQTKKDVLEFFITLSRIKRNISLEDVFFQGYRKQKSILEGLKETIAFIYDTNTYRSKGYEFLIGKIPTSSTKSPYKRWNMYLRWMVRESGHDMGLWKKVDKSSLLVPLDTHTFNVSRKLGLLKRKTYDFKSVLLLTEKLKEFDEEDPIKYDFALYRIGQEKII